MRPAFSAVLIGAGVCGLLIPSGPPDIRQLTDVLRCNLQHYLSCNRTGAGLRGHLRHP
jgi:hypothetical protein